MKENFAVDKSFHKKSSPLILLNEKNTVTEEESSDLVANARNIDTLLKWAPEVVLLMNEGNFMDKACFPTFSYDFENEGYFLTEENLPESFRKLK